MIGVLEQNSDYGSESKNGSSEHHESERSNAPPSRD